jgi:MFS family permease
VLGDVVGAGGGTVVAVFQMAGDLGAVIGPTAAGALADASGYGAAFALSAGVALLPLPFTAAARETLHGPPAPAEVTVDTSRPAAAPPA